MSSLTGMLVIQNANIAVLGKVLQQQQAEGAATQRMIAAAAVPPQGAKEPGKGGLVDVVA